MKYFQTYKTKSRRRKMLFVFSVALLLAGIYLLYLVLAPRVIPGVSLGNFKPLDPSNIAIKDNRVIIPKIGVNIDYREGDDSILEKSAWHRYPDRGNPEVGGNFILSAHRFVIGWTPQQTKAKSPFYNVGRLNEGDEIIVDFNGNRYKYIISKKYTVKPDAVDIESRSEDAKLTLYSCTLKGSHDGRDVIEAQLKPN